MKSILYILSGNLSTTPRALQSALTASKLYRVKIIGVNRTNKWLSFDKQLAEQHRLNYETVTINKEKLFIWVISGAILKFFSFISFLFPSSILVASLASSKINFLLWLRLRKEKVHYHFAIGHGATSLYSTWNYSKHHKIPFIFDVEDYHPGEYTNNHPDKIRVELLMQKLLPQASFLIFSSPLIADKTIELVGKSHVKRWKIINNCFPSNEFIFIQQTSNPKQQTSLVHFVWFSQNIASHRGLEIIIPELAKISTQVHLHLVGNLYEDFNKEWVIPNRHFISTYSPMVQNELNLFICQFDVGLALELNTTDYNRQICLTNKIWSYLQAGLYILASDTPAQVKFIDEQPQCGIIFKQKIPIDNEFSIQTCLFYILNNIEIIRALKHNRFENAKSFSFENESKILFKIWESL
jgi:glycosyltransferase involved in cell wall biosynthesis